MIPWRLQFGQCDSELPGDIGGLSLGPAAIPLYGGSKGLTLDESHRQEGEAIYLANVEDRTEVGMMETGGSLGLTEEPHANLCPLSEGMDMRNLERHLSLKLRVEGKVDAAHPASAKQPDNLVAAEGLWQRRTGGGQCRVQVGLRRWGWHRGVPGTNGNFVPHFLHRPSLSRFSSMML